MDNTTVAALLAITIGFVKVLEKIADWAYARYVNNNNRGANNNGNMSIVQLDPMASAALVEILKRTEKIDDLLSPRDNDGVPLIYFPRSSIHDIVARQRATLDKIDEIDKKIEHQAKE